MTKQTSQAFTTYLDAADGWARDRADELRASRRVAWIVASVAVVIALCEALALLFLMPLKRVEPYTLMVDKQTGFVQLLKPLNPDLLSSDAALTQSFLVQYVIAREEFDANTVQSDYRKTAIWSGGPARSDYLASMPASNPASPLARYPRTTTIEVRVKSVSPLGRNVALVRFDTLRHDLGRQPSTGQPFVAIIRYDFAAGAMSAEDRFINPLGFQVVRYRKNVEALPPEPASTADAAASPAAASPFQLSATNAPPLTAEQLRDIPPYTPPRSASRR